MTGHTSPKYSWHTNNGIINYGVIKMSTWGGIRPFLFIMQIQFDIIASTLNPQVMYHVCVYFNLEFIVVLNC